MKTLSHDTGTFKNQHYMVSVDPNLKYFKANVYET